MRPRSLGTLELNVLLAVARLEDKGFVSSRTTDPTPRRGGRSRRHFYLTAPGRRALQEARRLAASAWSEIGTLIVPEPT